MAEIYLAGGCFWGLEEYFSRIKGVTATTVGYANGKTLDTNYQEVKATDHAETVHVTYDQSVVSLYDILRYYFRVIDPLSVNKQGNDVVDSIAQVSITQTMLTCLLLTALCLNKSLSLVRSLPLRLSRWTIMCLLKNIIRTT